MFCSDSNPYGINIPIVPDYFFSPSKSVFKRVQKINSFNNTLQNLNTYNLRITKYHKLYIYICIDIYYIYVVYMYIVYYSIVQYSTSISYSNHYFHIITSFKKIGMVPQNSRVVNNTSWGANIMRVCKICGKCFNSYQDLTSHKSVHSNDNKKSSTARECIDDTF